MPACFSAPDDSTLSVIAAAREVPRKTAVIAGSRRVSYGELARAVSARAASSVRPEPGRPVFLTAGFSACRWCERQWREIRSSPQLTELLSLRFGTDWLARD